MITKSILKGQQMLAEGCLFAFAFSLHAGDNYYHCKARGPFLANLWQVGSIKLSPGEIRMISQAGIVRISLSRCKVTVKRQKEWDKEQMKKDLKFRDRRIDFVRWRAPPQSGKPPNAMN